MRNRLIALLLLFNLIILSTLGLASLSAFGVNNSVIIAVIVSLPCWSVVFAAMLAPFFIDLSRRRIRLKNKQIRAQVKQALTYQTQIERLLQANPAYTRRPHLQSIHHKVDEWTQAVRDLALCLDRFQQDQLIRRDLGTLPQSLKILQKRLDHETIPTVRSQLERTAAHRQNQLALLTQLKEIMKAAEVEIEHTLSALGTVYLQLLTSQSTEHIADYSHLTAEVDEQIHVLRDYLEALQEVKVEQAKHPWRETWTEDRQQAQSL